VSAAGSAYLAAVDAATPAWRNVDAMLSAHPGYIYRTDLLAQVDADAPFVASLRAITFPSDAVVAADSLIAAIEAYDAFLMAGYNDLASYVSNPNEDDHLNANRTQSSGHLRSVLGLPASTSTFLRP
jgi:hypothetical protein